MDIFHEQIVKKPMTGLRLLAKLSIALGFIILGALSFVLLLRLFPFSMLLAGVFIYLGWYLSTGMNVEYEYILTNDDLDIDKIIAKRKRKRLISIKVSSFTDFKKLTETDADAGSRTLVDCAGVGYDSADTYIADFKHDKLGDARLVFSPSEEMLRELIKVFPRQLRIRTGEITAKA
jgi:hypothetical protein